MMGMTLTDVLRRYGCTHEPAGHGRRRILDCHGRVISTGWTAETTWEWLKATKRYPKTGRSLGTVERCLSLHRPWARAIVRLGKDVENRDWKHAPGAWLVGQWLGIHAGQTWDRAGAAFIEAETGEALDGTPLGIVGAARVIGVIGAGPLGLAKLVAGDEKLVRPHLGSAWWMGSWGIVFDEALELDEPIPHKGSLGFWPPEPAALAALQSLVQPRAAG